MKKLFTFILSLLLVGAYTTASAQQNIYVWKDGNLSVVSAASIDSVSFSVDFNITTSAAFSVTNSSFKVVASVSLNDKVKSFSVLPEVGVCYSDENRKPTYEDSCVPLGGNITDYTANIGDVQSGTTYYYRTYVKLFDEVYYDSNVMSVTTLGIKPVVIDGHVFVDLGLPSGLLWAETNVGASSPSETGCYYAWGETENKHDYSWDSYKWYDKGVISKYNEIDGKTTLMASDDVATVKWGKGCRMPSISEFRELHSECSWTWNSDKGCDGYLVTGPSGCTIFIPVSNSFGYGSVILNPFRGSLWTVSVDPGNCNKALCFSFGYPFIEGICSDNRFCGRTVRPVAER